MARARSVPAMLAVRAYVPGDFDELVRAVFPGHQRDGVGSALLAMARLRSGDGLRLFTFRRNAPARAFHAKHGFVPVAFGVSPAPESEPDVEYRWLPGGLS